MDISQRIQRVRNYFPEIISLPTMGIFGIITWVNPSNIRVVPGFAHISMPNVSNQYHELYKTCNLIFASQNKQWKEVIYIKDDTSLETRVCGASEKRWSVGHLKDTGCGLRFGNTPGLRGFYGLIDDVSSISC